MKIFKYDGENVTFIEAEKISIEELDNSWLDFKGSVSENLFGLNFDKTLINEDEYSQVEDSGNYSLVKIGYIGKENKFKTIFIIIMGDNIITIHEEECSPINRLIKNLKPILKEEEEMIEFNDFILAYILYEISTEGMNAISTIDDLIESARNRLNKNGSDLITEISKIRTSIRTLSRVILYQASLIIDLKHGKGEFINAKAIASYGKDISSELDKYGKLANSLEKELDGLMQSLESKKISEYTKYTARLNVAIEILTRASVLLMIPNSIFTLWPQIFPQGRAILGIDNVWYEIAIATLSIVLSQIIIGRVYSKMKE